ncbi:UDP-glucuronosyltransferase 2A1 [Dermatophagoides pteronyssinus]|uniref:UDP-glucuronosyltransferase 2A1 n=1 Tax=Dermatophagoides pteronyssinus TaxID=6956 RepID=A0ABQ8J414_DERPT|nr:UDP-glucuronosyltransferase 2A1 [Dermatophagoides pteronyssinus]
MKIFIHVMDLVGPQNACIGLGQQLVQRGHQVIFLVNENFLKKFQPYSNQFKILGLKPVADEEPDENEKNLQPIQILINSFIRMGLFDPIKPIEKIHRMIDSKFIRNLGANAEAFEPQIRMLIEQEKPDIFLVDAKIMSPCIMNSSIPWVYVFCANPLGLFTDERLPPFSSDLPIDGDRKEWQEYRQILHQKYFDKVVARQREICEKFGYPAPKDQVFFPRSPLLNIYQFPKELDYDDTIKLPEHYQRVDAFVRDDPEPFELPDKIRKQMKPGDKLIFLSMGSMGSCNLELMKRFVRVLSKTPYYYLVSMGPLYDQYELSDNMWGGPYVPQTKILPLVDLVIFHGGNNTLTETVYFGKPMIVIPLFYDQYNNAQRVQEKNFGRRLDQHQFTDEQLIDTIDKLINDNELCERLKRIGQRIRTSQAKDLACKRIEQLVKSSKQN